MSDPILPGVIVEGEVLPEPLRVVLVQPVGSSLMVGGQGLRTKQYHGRVLSEAQSASDLCASPFGRA